MSASVVAVIATMRRPAELSRLLRALEKIKSGLDGVVVVDNGGDSEIQKIVEAATCNPHYIAPGKNLGCGGALALGEKNALEIFGEKLTHVWILDDDAVVAPDALTHLLEAMQNENAPLAVPMIVDAEGRIGWASGLLDNEKFRTLLESNTQADFLKRHGSAPVPLAWTQGISVLATRGVLEELGPHRTDFWLRGEDFEFALRITARHRGIFVPAVAVQHLMPSATQTPQTREMEYRKQCAMVQNVTFIGLRLPHGRRLLRNIPGRFYHHFKNWGVTPKTVFHALRMFWQGAVMGRPAGHPALKWPMPRG
jgi:GT2 family glycosyltransferase